MPRKYVRNRPYEKRNKERGTQASASSSSSNEYFEGALEMAKRYMQEHGEVPERPKELRGRDIGIWHAKMAVLRRSIGDLNTDKQNQKIRLVGDIKLTCNQRNDIRAILDDLEDKPSTSGSSINIRDSQFKRDYLENINGSIEQNMGNNLIEYEQDKLLDDSLYAEQLMKSEDPNYRYMLRKRQSLPSFKVKDEIIKLVESSQIVLISGETGCGKTTQVPQFLLDYHIENKRGSMCKIACTQPRRISAISVAERVANERAEKLGESTGYQIRLEKTLPRYRGSLLFCTTGVLLRQMQGDPCLSEYTHIILDEIHERDIQTDFLLTILKQIITNRSDLRVILMSATLNSESFSKYFDNCPHLNIPGFTYHVEEYFLEDVIQMTNYHFEVTTGYRNFKYRDYKSDKLKEFEDLIKPYLEKLKREKKYNDRVMQEISNPNSEKLDTCLVLKLLNYICENEKDQGGVLIFVPGYTNICDIIKMIESSPNFPRHKCVVIPLHSQLPTVEQKNIFNSPPPGVRKIVVSTNIAETSITIDDIVFVIDCGRIKITYYDIKTNTETLEALWVAKANACQRKGRAGRVKPGKCYHLVTRARYETFQSYILPEILRTRLENVILTAKFLQLGKIEDFFVKLMDSPNPEIVTKSLELLKQLEALDEQESLTPLGYHLAKLPMHPQIGKMLLFGAFFNCLNPVLNIAVTLDHKDAYLIPMGKEKEADRRRKELAGSCQSDHLLNHKLLETFEGLNDRDKRKFCWDNFLSFSTLTQLIKLKNDFMRNLFEMNFVPNANPKCEECNCNSSKMDVVIAVICSGLYPNIARVVMRARKKAVSSLYLLTGESVKFHPKSILNDQYITKKMIVYHRMVKSSSIFIHDASLVDSFHVIFFGNNFQQVTDKDDHFITINNLMKFKSVPHTSKVIEDLRRKLNNLLEYKITHPNVVDLRIDNEESALFRTIIELLENSCEHELEISGNQLEN